MRALALLPIVLAGCLSVPDSAPVECKSNADCDTANGEVCEENVCWGNPPPGPFAALIAPPATRKDELVSHELLLETIPQDGYFGDLALDEPVTYSGQVICPKECGTAMLAASIEVTRPSTFPGGPGFRQVFQTDPRTGTFQLVLPRVRPGDPEYTITVIPERPAASDTTSSMANLVPPLRTTLAINVNQTGKNFDLGGENQPVIISGTIVDALQNPASNYRVVALGRWDASSPVTEVSTVAFVREVGNAFSLRLSEGVFGKVEIVAQPTGPTLQPTLRLPNIAGDVNASNLKLVLPSIGALPSVPVEISVEGTGTGGEVSGVSAAHVTVTGSVPVSGSTTIATFLVEGDTDSNGTVSLQAPGGDFLSTYKVTVVPQASATVGVVLDREITQGQNRIKLPDRVAIAGKVVDAEGRPLEGVQVTAVPSLRFQWSLSTIPQTFVTTIPSSTTTTPDTGEFVLHIDPSIIDTGSGDAVDVFAFYDLRFTPNETSNAPSWTVFDVEVPRDSQLSQVALPPTVLPDAAHIHGRIVDPFGEVIESAELKLFRVVDPMVSAVSCDGLIHAPASCPIPATLLGRGVTDVAGIARLTLPR